MTARYAHRDEVFEAGDAFYTPPGHVPVQNEPGTEFVSFSPSEELRTCRSGHDEEHAGDAGGLNALRLAARVGLFAGVASVTTETTLLP